MKQAKDAPAIVAARRVTYKLRILSNPGNGSLIFLAAIVQKEHGAVDLGRPIRWICGCEGQCVSDSANDRGEI